MEAGGGQLRRLYKDDMKVFFSFFFHTVQLEESLDKLVLPSKRKNVGKVDVESLWFPKHTFSMF
jgi:hypothetical protein